MIPAAAVLALLLAPPPALAAELGRLFYTPEQRASLDAARAKRQRTTVATEEDTQPAPPPAPTAEVITYGGIVRRSDGSTTVWLNEKAVAGKEAAAKAGVRRVGPDGTVTLQSAQSGRNVNLQVGQRAELISGTVKEGYLPAAPPKPSVAQDAPPAGRPDAAAPAAAPPDTRAREDIEQRERLDQAIRALQEAAAAKAAGVAPAPALK